MLLFRKLNFSWLSNGDFSKRYIKVMWYFGHVFAISSDLKIPEIFNNVFDGWIFNHSKKGTNLFLVERRSVAVILVFLFVPSFDALFGFLCFSLRQLQKSIFVDVLMPLFQCSFATFMHFLLAVSFKLCEISFFNLSWRYGKKNTDLVCGSCWRWLLSWPVW